MSTLSMRQDPRYAFVRSRETSYRLAVPAAMFLVLILALTVPRRWVESLAPPRDVAVDTFDTEVGRPGEVRIIPIQVEAPSAEPVPGAFEVVPEAELSSVEPASPVRARERWTFDPSTPFRYGDVLLRPAPSLADQLLAKQAQASPVLAMLHPDLSSTWEEQARAGFETGHDIHRWGWSRAWAEEMRRKRMDAYWEKYILSDGEP